MSKKKRPTPPRMASAKTPSPLLKEKMMTKGNYNSNSHNSQQNSAREFKDQHPLVDIAGRYTKLKPRGKDFVGLCPFHQEKTPSFYVYRDSQQYYCFGCGEHGDVINFIKKIEGKTFRDVVGRDADRKLSRRYNIDGGYRNSTSFQKQEKEKKIIEARSIWDNSSNAWNTPAERYLCSRGLTVTPPETIRFHPNLKYSEQDNNDVWHESCHPAMVACVQKYPSNDCVGIHRAYLKNDGFGKADVSSPKKMLGDCLGGAVRFQGESLEGIALSEGIETGLSYWQENYWMTVWACLSTSGMKSIILPPPDVTPMVVILADNDGSGIKAAKELADRLTKEGRKVYPITPERAGDDMNSILTGAI